MGAFNGLLAFLWVGVREIFRDKTALFWTVIFPAMMVSISAGLWSNPNPRPLHVGVYIADTTAGPFNATTLLKVMEASGLFSVSKYSNLSKLISDIRSGRGPALGLYIPDGFAHNASRGLSATLRVYRLNVSELWSEVDFQRLVGFLKGFEERTRGIRLKYVISYTPKPIRPYLIGLVYPLKIEVEGVKPALSFTSSKLKAIMALSMAVVEVLMIGLGVGTSMIHEEREANTLRTILASPTPSWAILAGYTLSSLIWIAISTMVCLTTGLAMGAEYSGIGLAGALITALLLILATLFSVGLGLLLSPLAKTSKGASGLASAVGLPLMFLGGIWIPAWMLPEPFRTFATYFPLSKVTHMIKAISVFNEPPLEVLLSTPPSLIIVTVVVYAAGVMMYRKLLLRAVEA